MENGIKDSSYPPVFLDGNRVNVFCGSSIRNQRPLFVIVYIHSIATV